ncbi:MAG TPA: hypothetical protein VEA35_13725 [Ramlibacter sp.]|nr:hypothetical protein [Ramlibacter sp.]
MTAAVTPIETARERTQTIQQELEVAGAELHLTNSALESSLPAAAKKGDVGKALEQNAAIEEKVLEAAEDLQAVTELLAEEVAQRAWLERELAISRASRK